MYGHYVVFLITWHLFQRACGLLHVHLRSQPWYVEESCLLPSFNHGTNVILSFKAFNPRLILSIVIFGMTSQTHYYYYHRHHHLYIITRSDFWHDLPNPLLLHKSDDRSLLRASRGWSWSTPSSLSLTSSMTELSGHNHHQRLVI